MTFEYSRPNVETFKHGNDDLTVVNTARVSFNKRTDTLTTKDKKLIKFLAREKHIAPFCHTNLLFYMEATLLEYSKFIQYNLIEESIFRISTLSVSNTKVKFLIRGSVYAFARHTFNDGISRRIMSRFPAIHAAFRSTGVFVDVDIKISSLVNLTQVLDADMPIAIKTLKDMYGVSGNDLFKLIPYSFSVTAPIFSARQHFKTSVGIVRSEPSRRYISTDPVYAKIEHREKATNVKQGSVQDKIIAEIGYSGQAHVALADTFYKKLLAEGVAPECARGYLPQCMMVNWIETGSLSDFSRLISLRTEEHAQKDIREYVDVMQSALKDELSEYWDELSSVYKKGVLQR